MMRKTASLQLDLSPAVASTQDPAQPETPSVVLAGSAFISCGEDTPCVKHILSQTIKITKNSSVMNHPRGRGYREPLPGAHVRHEYSNRPHRHEHEPDQVCRTAGAELVLAGLSSGIGRARVSARSTKELWRGTSRSNGEDCQARKSASAMWRFFRSPAVRNQHRLRLSLARARTRC